MHVHQVNANFRLREFLMNIVALIYLGFAIVSIAYWLIHNMTVATANKIAQIRETSTQKKSGKTSKKKSKKFEGGNYGAVEDEVL